MTYRCRTCGRDNRLPNQCGCEPRNNVRTDYLSDAGTDRVLAAINRHEDASERVDGALADLERIEREHQAYLRQTLDTIVAARIELLEMCLEEPILTPLSEFPPREIE